MKLLPPPCSSRVWQKQAEKKPGSRHPWDGEVHYEEVGDAVQLLALDHGDADQDVAGDAAREDDRVENAEYDLTVVRSLARAGMVRVTEYAQYGLWGPLIRRQDLLISKFHLIYGPIEINSKGARARKWKS